MPAALPGGGAGSQFEWGDGIRAGGTLTPALLDFSGATAMTRFRTIQRRFVSGETTTALADMPTGRTTTKIAADWSDADLQDNAKTVDVRLEYSINGGTNWFTWCGVATAGATVGPRGLRQPSMTVDNAPPAGALLRIREIPNGAGLDTGAVVEFG